MQERHNSIADALELRLSFTNPSIWETILYQDFVIMSMATKKSWLQCWCTGCTYFLRIKKSINFSLNQVAPSAQPATIVLKRWTLPASPETQTLLPEPWRPSPSSGGADMKRRPSLSARKDFCSMVTSRYRTWKNVLTWQKKICVEGVLALESGVCPSLPEWVVIYVTYYSDVTRDVVCRIIGNLTVCSRAWPGK